VLSDILQAVDSEDLDALVLLNLLEAVDTVDHEILLERLQMTYGIDETAHRLVSFLSAQSIAVHSLRTFQVVDRSSDIWVPQGLVPGPVLSLHRRSDLAD
jgi:hypothetical protein